MILNQLQQQWHNGCGGGCVAVFATTGQTPQLR